MRYYTDAEFVGNDSAWFSTFGQGIVFFTPENYKFYVFDTDNYITNVSTFDKKVIWFIAFNKGIIKYDNGSFTLIDHTCGLKSNKINYIMHDNKNRLWLATEKDGINVIANGQIAEINIQNGLTDNRVNYIYQDSQNSIWIGTENGINVITNNKIAQITRRNGLISNNIKSIVEDSFGNIWISTNLGISKLIKNDTNSFYIKNYDSSYGLFMNDFFGLSTSFNNKLIFAKREDFVTYNAAFDDFQKAKPILSFDKIIFNSDTITGSLFSENQMFKVQAGNFFYAEFTGILWNAEKSLSYAYVLINSDKDTVVNEKTTDNYLQLSNLNPDTYQLIIRVTNDEGNDDASTINIKFLPFWWQTIWALEALFVIVLIFIVVVIKIVNFRQKAYQRTLENEVYVKTHELHVKNKINEALLAEVHHRVKNNLQKISSLIYLNLDFIENDNPRNILLEIDLRLNTMALVHEMLYSKANFESIPLKEYIEELVISVDNTLNSGNFQINYIFDIPKLTLNISHSINLGMFINEAITNSIKYAFDNINSPEILISLSFYDKNYIFCIADNGNGIPHDKKNKENSLGMKLFDIFARQMDAKLEIVSEKGTAIKLIIPSDYFL